MDSSKPPPAESNIMILLLCAACLVTLSMLFSIAESSFLSINKLRLRSKINRREKRALRAGKLLKEKEKLLNTLLVANELVNILLSSILTATALKMFGASGVGIATAVTTLFLLIFGEITPKAVSTRYPDFFAYGLSFFVLVTVKILSPIIPVFTFISRLILKIFGISTEKENKSFSEEEIKTIIDIGSESGIIDKSEKNMMHKVFRFTDLEAQSIMIPRTKIISVPVSAKYRDIIELSERSHLSRFPVYRKDIDDIVGILYVKDLLFYEGLKKDFSVQNIMRPPLFIPGTKSISYVQTQLSQNHQTIAIVIDEYSGTDGILTKEDIFSEIFGFIKNNTKKAQNLISLNNLDGADSKSFTVSGETRLLELQEHLHIQLNSEINETIGGWITEKLDHIPEAGEKVEFSGFQFTVKKINLRRIETVEIQNLSGDEEGTASEFPAEKHGGEE